MKAGLTTSIILHAALIGFGLFTLSAPRALQVADVESFPVDIVPVSSLSQIQQGDKKAPKKEKSAPVPTTKPAIVPDAKKIGDNSVDTDKKPTPDPTPKPVEAKDAPPPAPEPAPRPDPEPVKEPVKEADKKPADVPATETASIPEPKQEVKPDPVAEAIVADKPDAEQTALPDSAPTPQARPQPPQPQTAKAPDHKDTDKPTVKQAAKPKSEDRDVLAEAAALLDKQKASGGGAQRSTDEASLGGDKKTGSKLSQSEMDALRGQIERCWNVPAGSADAENQVVVINASLTPEGEVDGTPQIVKGGGSDPAARAAAESARRAVMRCGPYTLPPEKYDGDGGWNQVQITFDPSEMF
jgi:outer membrane biosynthesis protein TonB